MKRRWKSMVVCLVIGAVAQVLVAWAGVAYSDWSTLYINAEMNTPEMLARGWPKPAPDDWPEVTQIARCEHFLASFRQWSGVYRPAKQAPMGWVTYGWMRMSAGRPFRSLIFEQGTMTGMAAVPPVTSGIWQQGVMLPDGMRVPLKMAQQKVPIRPIALGFVANSLLYGSVLWGLWMMPWLVRGKLRARSGACLGCGYELAGLARCPECGEEVIHR